MAKPVNMQPDWLVNRVRARNSNQLDAISKK
jgi:hypothetical protein